MSGGTADDLFKLSGANPSPAAQTAGNPPQTPRGRSQDKLWTAAEDG